MILLDTDTLTHFSYGNVNVRRRIAEAGNEPIAVAIITRNEILRGRAESLLKAAKPEELRNAMERYRLSERLLSAFVVADFNEDSIKHFEILSAQRRLKKMGRADLLIACIALGHAALLVTRNTKDFETVAGLRLDNWVD